MPQEGEFVKTRRAYQQNNANAIRATRHPNYKDRDKIFPAEFSQAITEISSPWMENGVIVSRLALENISARNFISEETSSQASNDIVLSNQSITCPRILKISADTLLLGWKSLDNKITLAVVKQSLEGHWNLGAPKVLNTNVCLLFDMVLMSANTVVVGIVNLNKDRVQFARIDINNNNIVQYGPPTEFSISTAMLKMAKITDTIWAATMCFNDYSETWTLKFAIEPYSNDENVQNMIYVNPSIPDVRDTSTLAFPLLDSAVLEKLNSNVLLLARVRSDGNVVLNNFTINSNDILKLNTSGQGGIQGARNISMAILTATKVFMCVYAQNKILGFLQSAIRDIPNIEPNKSMSRTEARLLMEGNFVRIQAYRMSQDRVLVVGFKSGTQGQDSVAKIFNINYTNGTFIEELSANLSNVGEGQMTLINNTDMGFCTNIYNPNTRLYKGVFRIQTLGKGVVKYNGTKPIYGISKVDAMRGENISVVIPLVDNHA